MDPSDPTPIDGVESVEAVFALRNLPDRQRDAFRRLLDEGPLTIDDLDPKPIMTPLQRLFGMTKFSVSGRSNTAAEHATTLKSNGTQPVYYLYFDHTPAQVVDAFCDVNPSFTDSLTIKSAEQLLSQHGSEFAAAVRPVLADRIENPNADVVHHPEDADV